MVTRLDGPSARLAMGLVDKAIDAETHGLWGRAYFDQRGLTNGEYVLGDQWINAAAEISRQTGFETVVDTRAATFPSSFPLSHVAFYAGWYDADVSGPFSLADVEFMPGAVAYHLHSFSAKVLRTAEAHWAGPLIAKGATVTVGYVGEPYLSGTLDLPQFWGRFIILGGSLGEAIYGAQPVLSWQATVIGDPLYRPFGRSEPGQSLGDRLRMLHRLLGKENSPYVEWSHLQVANLNLVRGFPVSEVVAYLEEQSMNCPSAVLREKLGNLYRLQGEVSLAINAYRAALGLEPRRQQRKRLMLELAELLSGSHQREALAVYEQFVAVYADYPELPFILERMRRLRLDLGD
jgi:tetratricopeptide (TPR) repeat protein